MRRNPKKGRYDPATVEANLDRAVIAHVAFVARGEAVCIPMLFARVERTTAGLRTRAPDDPLDTERVESLPNDRTGGAALYPRLGSRQHQAARVGEDDECEALTAYQEQ